MSSYHNAPVFNQLMSACAYITMFPRSSHNALQNHARDTKYFQIFSTKSLCIKLHIKHSTTCDSRTNLNYILYKYTSSLKSHPCPFLNKDWWRTLCLNCILFQLMCSTVPQMGANTSTCNIESLCIVQNMIFSLVDRTSKLCLHH